MTGTSPNKALTITAEMEALGLGSYYIIHEAERLGRVSARELVVFRDAITERKTQLHSGETEISEFEPDPNLTEDAQQRLKDAHMIGSTAADILVGQDAVKNFRSQA